MLPRVRPRPILILIVAVAVLVRAVALSDRLSADEGYTWLVASSHGLGAFLDRLAAFENTPPLYYVLAWPLPHGDEASLRIPSLVAGVGCVVALYAAVRPLAGTRAALLAAAALAVAPYAVSYSDYARGFVLADLGLIVALAGAVRRRWWIYTAGAAVALYSEYDSALFLIALALAVAWSGLAPRREALVRGLLPLLLLVPWIPEIERGADAVDVTKVSPTYPGPSLGALRDIVVRLTFGEHGTAHAAGLRWLQFLIVAAVLVVAARSLARPAFRLLAGTALGTLALHALVQIVGPDVFAPRYLTELIPLGAAAVGIWVDGLRVRWALPVAAAVLAGLGIAVIVQRSGRETEPNVAAIGRLIAPAAGSRVVLTNSAVVSYYLRDLHPRLDKPFGLGPGLEAGCVTPCRASFVVVDDTRVAGGARAGPGRAQAFGPIYVRVTP
jgi:4-amino-4-deoxy-L-arabinose transferase-like glycosyltransferase